MRLKLWIIPFIMTGVFFSFSLSAQEDSCDPCSVKVPDPCPCDDPGPFYNQGQGLCPDRLESGYSAPAAYDVCGSWDVFINASFIYWQFREEGLALARKDSLVNGITNIAAKIKETKWQYKPGFKVTLGMNLPHDGWNLLGEYTRVNGTNNNSGRVPAGSIIQPFWIDTVDTSSANIVAASHRWKYWLDMGDFIMGRPYYLGTYLTVKPFLGVRGGRLDQDFFASYEINDGSYDLCKNKSDSWFVGPRFGMDTNWFVHSDFRLISNIGASLFYQRAKAKLQEIDQVTTGVGPTLSVKGTNRRKGGRINPNANLEFGLGWGRYFDRSNWHVDVLAKYEFIVFWNQNYMRALNESSYIGLTVPPTIVPFHLSDPNPGDLAIHGLTITAQFDF